MLQSICWSLFMLLVGVLSELSTKYNIMLTKFYEEKSVVLLSQCGIFLQWKCKIRLKCIACNTAGVFLRHCRHILLTFQVYSWDMWSWASALQQLQQWCSASESLQLIIIWIQICIGEYKALPVLCLHIIGESIKHCQDYVHTSFLENHPRSFLHFMIR